MTISHHLDPATLMAYAAGTLAPAVTAVAAQHIAMCAHCRHELDIAQRIGRAMVERLAPVDTAAAPDIGSRDPGASPKARELSRFVQLIGNPDEVPWRRIGPGLWHHRLEAGGDGTLHLLKAAPGAKVPTHDHTGDELTLVLQGALLEGPVRFAVGDVADHDTAEVEHEPAADPDEGCICVIGAEGKVRFRGLLARLMQPYHGM